jgi:hypothetical protein
MKFKNLAKQNPVEAFLSAAKQWPKVAPYISAEGGDPDILFQGSLDDFLRSETMAALTNGRGLEGGRMPDDLFGPSIFLQSLGWFAVRAFAHGYAAGRDDRKLADHVEAASGPKGRKGTPGELRQALIAISEAIHSKDPEKILDAMEDENLVEDLYGAAPKPKINIHLFQINRMERTVDYTRRNGKDAARSLKTVENLIAKL